MKQKLRQRARELASHLDAEWRERASENVLSQLREVLAGLEYRSIGLYRAMSDEVDLSRFFSLLAAEGKELYLPRVLDGEHIAFYRYECGDGLDVTGAYKIEEPLKSAELCAKPLDVLLVPAVHYYNNYRLGRGKGYYDRYMAEYPAGQIIGLSLGLLGDAPFAPDVWDKPVDLSLRPKI